MRKSINSKIPALRFRDFSDSWKEVHIADIAEVFSGGTPDTTNKELWGNDIEWFTPTEVGKTKYVHQSKRKLSYLGLQKSSAKLLSPGTILLSTRATIGEMSITTKHASTNQGFQSLTCKPTVNNEFIYYSGRIIKRQCLVGSNGSTFLEISKKDVEKVKLRVPSILEQNMIADFFSLLDSRIESQEQIIKNLEQLKKGYMQKIFSQQLRFKDENGEDFPKWEEKLLGDIAICYDSKRVPLNTSQREQITGDIPYYGANGVQGYINDYLFDETIILLAEDGGNFEDFKNRPIAQIVKGKSWVNNHAHVLKAIGNDEFLFYSLVHKDITRFINGTSRSKLNKSEMLLIDVNLPSIKEQEKIGRFLSLCDEKIDIETKKFAMLNELKKAYLQQMFV